MAGTVGPAAPRRHHMANEARVVANQRVVFIGKAVVQYPLAYLADNHRPRPWIIGVIGLVQVVILQLGQRIYWVAGGKGRVTPAADRGAD